MLTLAAGAGQVGRQMVANGWSLPIFREQSLIRGGAHCGSGDR